MLFQRRGFDRQTGSTMIDLWYKHAIVYELDVETFRDGNGDGTGDFVGLTQRLDYLSGLDLNCVWLMPFYPTPNRDNGYDVSDYYCVDPKLGSLGDFVEFVRQARERGIRVIVDLIMNHTSDEHPWFQAARSDPKSPFRDWYVWSDTRPDNAEEGIVFPGEQESVWTWDEEAGAYYYHRFYHFQPDLNIANPQVRQELCKVMGFWLELGVSGFRLDALPFVIEQTGLEETLREFRQFLSWRRGDAIMLAEANVLPEDVPRYVDHGNKVQMLFNFLVNQPLFLALARRRAEPLLKALRTLPQIGPIGQYANFLRNHDELDLGRLTEEERQETFAAFAPEKSMQIYERGIRRRLPPMLENDRRRIEMAYSLMFALPGTPVMRYGDEIGMGDDQSLEGRNPVRTPMQWSDEENAGFSTAPADKLPWPVISGGEYGYQRVNVVSQRRDDDSLLNWTAKMIRTRRDCPEIGHGKCEILDARDPAVLALRCSTDEGAVVSLHNFDDRKAGVRVAIDEARGEHLVELIGPRRFERIDHTKEIDLDPYGYRWYRVCGPGLKTF